MVFVDGGGGDGDKCWAMRFAPLCGPFGIEPISVVSTKGRCRYRKEVRMTELFPELSDAEIKPKPRKLDLRTEWLKERYNLPEDWVWHSFESIGTDYSHTIFKGGVYRHAIQRGKYKGRTDYKRPDPGTEMALVMEDAVFMAWLPVWEKRTGKCSVCHGSGQKWTGWSAAEGNHYIDCPRCDATGNAPASGMEARQGESAAAPR